MKNYNEFITLAFDLDGTLAESKQRMSPEIAGLLVKLSNFYHIAVISGGDWPQFKTQVLSSLQEAGLVAARSARHWKFHMLPTCGSKKYRQIGGGFDAKCWTEVADQKDKLYFSPMEFDEIVNAFEVSFGLWPDRPTGQIWGPQIEDRGTQITYSALGQMAPVEEKAKWDADASKRKRLRELLISKLGAERFHIKIGGATSIDITRVGIDKAYAIKNLCRDVPCAPEQILFYGDALFDGGNDSPVKTTGCEWIETTGPSNTAELLKEVLLWL